MSSRFQQLLEKGLLPTPPKVLKNNVCYEVITGSMAYGVATDTSDMDIIGFAIPPKETLFPHLTGYIDGFSTKQNKFEQYQQHHIMDKSARSGKGTEYDITMYNIVKFFRLCMENNPNMVDVLFVPRNCVLHSTGVGELVRENRKLFLHKGSYQKFKGYAYSQLNKMQNKNLNTVLKFEREFDISDEVAHQCYAFPRNKAFIENVFCATHLPLPNYSDAENYANLIRKCGTISKRRDSIKEHKMDVKFAYHIVRLLGEVEQILTLHDLDLQRDKEVLKSIRRGEWSVEKITEYFEMKEKHLEELYNSSTLRYSPDEDAIRDLLLQCLEQHYGNLESCVTVLGTSEKALQEIVATLNKYKVI